MFPFYVFILSWMTLNNHWRSFKVTRNIVLIIHLQRCSVAITLIASSVFSSDMIMSDVAAHGWPWRTWGSTDSTSLHLRLSIAVQILKPVVVHPLTSSIPPRLHISVRRVCALRIHVRFYCIANVLHKTWNWPKLVFCAAMYSDVRNCCVIAVLPTPGPPSTNTR